MSIPVTEAEQTLAGLETKHAEAVVRLAEIEAERKPLALDAETGDAKARTALDKLDAEDVTLTVRLRRLDAAMAQARVRLSVAEQARDAAAEQAALALIPPVTAEIRQHAAKLDALAAEMKSEVDKMLRLFPELYRAGFSRPALHVVHNATRRAMLAAFMSSPLQTEHLAPPERHTFSELATNWTSGIDATVTARLGMEAVAA